MLELLFKKLPNINHLISKSILTKLIPTELILPKINSTNAESNMHKFDLRQIDRTN